MVSLNIGHYTNHIYIHIAKAGPKTPAISYGVFKETFQGSDAGVAVVAAAAAAAAVAAAGREAEYHSAAEGSACISGPRECSSTRAAEWPAMVHYCSSGYLHWL